ncbi:hypothetical protein [Nocardioides terrisoli]|uniref:hypothetical protein n=1 Tax=Nocardioides terrisoli TaxID=3388267 RepID=UPI00287B6677|nr:hypothetical protein [Nocardioides marmorisolisilvae]
MSPEWVRGGVPLAGLVNIAMQQFVADAGRRRKLPVTLHVGLPGGETRSVCDQPWYDHGLRADLATCAIDGLEVPDPLAWISRGGDLKPHDADWDWLAAARTAHDRHGLAMPGFFLVTRYGWAELVGGQQHPWHRVRPARLLRHDA